MLLCILWQCNDSTYLLCQIECRPFPMYMFHTRHPAPRIMCRRISLTLCVWAHCNLIGMSDMSIMNPLSHLVTIHLFHPHASLSPMHCQPSRHPVRQQCKKASLLMLDRKKKFTWISSYSYSRKSSNKCLWSLFM